MKRQILILGRETGKNKKEYLGSVIPEKSLGFCSPSQEKYGDSGFIKVRVKFWGLPHKWMDGDRESRTTATVWVLIVAPYLTQVPGTRPWDKNSCVNGLRSYPRRNQKGNERKEELERKMK